MSNLSPAPGTAQSGTKAYVATALSLLSIFVGQWVLDTDPVTAKEVASWLVTALIGSGITGVGSYVVRNSAKESGYNQAIREVQQIDDVATEVEKRQEDTRLSDYPSGEHDADDEGPGYR